MGGERRRPQGKKKGPLPKMDPELKKSFDQLTEDAMKLIDNGEIGQLFPLFNIHISLKLVVVFYLLLYSYRFFEVIFVPFFPLFLQKCTVKKRKHLREKQVKRRLQYFKLYFSVQSTLTLCTCAFFTEGYEALSRIRSGPSKRGSDMFGDSDDENGEGDQPPAKQRKVTGGSQLVGPEGSDVGTIGNVTGGSSTGPSFSGMQSTTYSNQDLSYRIQVEF